MEKPAEYRLTFWQNFIDGNEEELTYLINDKGFIQALVNKQPDVNDEAYDNFWDFINNLALHPGIIATYASTFIKLSPRCEVFSPSSGYTRKCAFGSLAELFLCCNLGL